MGVLYLIEKVLPLFKSCMYGKVNDHHLKVKVSSPNYYTKKCMKISGQIDCLQCFIFPAPSLFILWAQPGERTTIHWGGGCRGYELWRPWFFHASSRPWRLPSWWIVVLSPGCTHNINKDGALFGVRVRSWGSCRKVEDCKQSSEKNLDLDFRA